MILDRVYRTLLRLLPRNFDRDEIPVGSVAPSSLPALGAPRHSVVRAMVWRSCRLALVGVAVGVAVSLAGGRLLTFFLYSVTP